jgi:hypothetical protein
MKKIVAVTVLSVVLARWFSSSRPGEKGYAHERGNADEG